MTSQNNKGELKKVSKRIFAPPVAKPLALCSKGETEPLRKQGDAQAKKIPLNHCAGSGAPRMEPKPRKTKVNKKTQDKRLKESTTVEGKHCCDYSLEEGYLTDAQFEEIVQSVLQKSLQECMGETGKRVAVTEPAKEQVLESETLETILAVEDAVPGKPSQGKGEAILLAMEQKEHLPRTKKYSRLLGNKDKKEKNEKPEADNGGRKENRKGAPKKKVQGNARILVDQEEMQEEEADRGSGCFWCMAWVQCSYPTCEKWRRLSSDIDPSVLPEDWSCSQNPDHQYNSCSVPEETWSGSENEVVYAVYIPGSIVWAKQYGYPWWPGMIEADPDLAEYFLFSSQEDSLPSKYHVTFFGNSATRAWISASLLRNFGEPDVEGNSLTKLKGKRDKKNLEAALRMAKEAEQINIQERIRIFGFSSRFSGREPPKDVKDLKCKPCAKKIQEPSSGSKDTAASITSQEKLLLGKPVMKPDGNLNKKTNIKGAKERKVTTEDSFPLTKKSRREVSSHKTIAVPKGSGKAKVHQDGQKGSKKSFTVPQSKNPKAAEWLSSCTARSTGNLVLSSHSGKKDSLNEAEIFHAAERKLLLSKGLEASDEPMAVVAEEEAALGSQEMSVSAEGKCYSPEDFSLVFYEE
ncbi:zinc finger CW-type PWWP domain protein 1 isoform X2 [Hemicordylus capensis]|uniref:zinc finger CW-type PWWP domain protein 1 isoform X2 n=1 Tax=Hemicordylus capensis TaxID=884348 RepID=UPI0023027627|nr:zinc finger CW-type PWWP domain protein 1 isoform X2 [Hemicordylus capensis]